MKRILTFVVFLALVTTAARAEMGVVKTDRVNLRAQAKANAEVITQLGRGDRLTILDKKTVPYGQRSMTWLKVALPDKATVWIKSEFVKEGVVTADKVNLRAGAGANFSIVGMARRGHKLEVLRTLADWSEIRPLPGSFGWVSSDYVELTPELQPPPASETIKPAKSASPPARPTAATTTPVKETPSTTPAPAPIESAGSSTVVVSAGKPVTCEGTIYSCAGMLLKRPGTHALWMEGLPNAHLIAYLNSPTISLEPFESRKVQIIGTETVLANWNNPVIEVQQVQPMW